MFKCDLRDDIDGDEEEGEKKEAFSDEEKAFDSEDGEGQARTEAVRIIFGNGKTYSSRRENRWLIRRSRRVGV